MDSNDTFKVNLLNIESIFLTWEVLNIQIAD